MTLLTLVLSSLNFLGAFLLHSLTMLGFCLFPALHFRVHTAIIRVLESCEIVIQSFLWGVVWASQLHWGVTERGYTGVTFSLSYISVNKMGKSKSEMYSFFLFFFFYSRAFLLLCSNCGWCNTHTSIQSWVQNMLQYSLDFGFEVGI